MIVNLDVNSRKVTMPRSGLGHPELFVQSIPILC